MLYCNCAPELWMRSAVLCFNFSIWGKHSLGTGFCLVATISTQSADIQFTLVMCELKFNIVLST